MSNLHLSASSVDGGAAPIMAKRTKTKSKSKPQPKPSTRTSIFKTNNVSPCTECGKQFNGWKALFGHMRCHPERQWRGMNKKSKPKPKPKQKQQDWAAITEEVTHAASILMQMSGGWSSQQVFTSSRVHVVKKSNLWIDLNFPPPAETIHSSNKLYPPP